MSQRTAVTAALATLVQRHPAPTWIQAVADGRLLAISDAALSALGRTADAVLGQAFEALFDRGEAERLRDGALLEGGKFVLWHAVEGPHPALLRCARIPWDGEPALLVTFQDGRDADELAEALRQSQASFRNMADNVPGALYRYLHRPDGTSAVQYMSPRCVDIFEVDPAVVYDDASVLWDQVHPDDVAALAASVQASAESLTPWFHEWRTIPASGRTKWLQGSGRPRPAADGDVLFDSFILDVSALRAAEAERQRLQDEIQRASRLEALGRMAGGIAHDFNNLLTVLIGHAELALLSLPSDAPARSDLDALLAAADRATALTAQLLAYASRQPSPPTVLDLASHVRDARPLLERLAGPDMRLAVDLPEGPAHVHLGPAQADQVLTNLVANARDASQVGAEIRVAVTRDGAGVHLVVADAGEGMSAETLKRIYEPFFTTRGHGRGTGLGLPTVYKIIEAAGGTIDVSSAPDAGTTFRLSLPEAAPTAAPERSPATLRGRVLVVDDEAPIRELVARAIRAAGAEVRQAADAAQARVDAESNRPDLLITDIAMPGASGWHLAQQLRGIWPDLPVLFITGYVADAATRRALAHADDEVLFKPFTLDAVVEAAQRAIAKRDRAR